MNLALSCFYISLALNLFFPEMISLGKIKADDIFFLLSLLLALITQFILSSNRGAGLPDNKGYKNCVLYIILLFSFMVSVCVLQILYYAVPAYYPLDLIKVVKFTYPFVLFYLLTEQERFNFRCVTIKILKVFVVLTFFICMIQLVIPHSSIFHIFASSTPQFQSLEHAPYGFIGNRTHAGYISLLIFMTFMMLKYKFYSILAFLNVVLHLNKISILSALLVLVIMTLSDDNIKNGIKITLLTLMVSIGGGIVYFLVWPLIANVMELGVDKVHTFSHRLSMLQLLNEAYNRHGIAFFFMGFPNKNDWEQAFDSQYILMTFRYGFPITIAYTILPLFIYRLRKNYIAVWIVYLVPLLTMINTYHYRVALISAVVLLIITYQNTFIKGMKIHALR